MSEVRFVYVVALGLPLSAQRPVGGLLRVIERSFTIVQQIYSLYNSAMLLFDFPTLWVADRGLQSEWITQR
jgi:hypothetical protein